MASLEMIEKTAELCQACDASFVALFVFDEVPESWSECDQKGWKERVFNWFTGSPVLIENNPDRTALFTAICGAVMVQTNPPKKVEDKRPIEVRVREQAEEETGGWIDGPDGKPIWTGKPREARLRTATPEMLAKIQERIREAEAKAKANESR